MPVPRVIVPWLAAAAQFDQKNHWIIDRGDGAPSVNLVILSFVQPLKPSLPVTPRTRRRCG